MRARQKRWRSASSRAISTRSAPKRLHSSRTRIDLRGQRHRGPVELDDQDRTRVARQPRGVHRVLDGADRALIDDLERRGHERGLDHGAHRAARGDHVGEDREQRLDRFGNRLEAHRDRGDDAERALAADDRADPVEPGREPGGVAELEAAPVGQHELEREHVIGGGAVLQRVRAARVLGDVAAERARELARRIGRVEQAVRPRRGREVGVDHAGLDDRDAVVRIERADPVQARALDHDRAVVRERAAREPRPGAARHERHAVLAARAHDPLHLLARFGKHHRGGLRGVQREAVALVDEQLLAAVQAARGADDGLEGLDHGREGMRPV